jgi:hypothetical protein
MACCRYTYLQTLDRKCPSADGKSSILDSGEPPPCSINSNAMVNSTNSFRINKCPDPPHHRLRWGEATRTAGPKSCENGQDGRSATKLQRDPPREGKTAAPKSRSDFAATSMMSPFGHLLEPTLCTRRDPGFPHPPAAKATGGGRGNWGIAAGEVGQLGEFRKRLSATVVGERGDVQGRMFIE